MSRGLSERGVVGVEVTLVQVAALGEPGHEEPQHDHGQDALPDGRGNLVPHLLVQQVNLLQALQVVQARGSVGKGPHSQVMHVSQDVPVMAEGDLVARSQ